MNATERYKALQKEFEIVDVTVPSGFVFQFQKPSKSALLFRYGKMPQVAANGAVQAWIEQGVIKEGDFTPDQEAKLDETMRIRDRVLELSYCPKLVLRAADGDDEMSVDDLSDEDSAYLLQWVAAGGDESVMLSTFPNGRRSNALASSSRKKRRHATK